MTRRDDVGEPFDGYGAEDTMLDGDGDNTGDAGDRYQGFPNALAARWSFVSTASGCGRRLVSMSS